MDEICRMARVLNLPVQKCWWDFCTMVLRLRKGFFSSSVCWKGTIVPGSTWGWEVLSTMGTAGSEFILIPNSMWQWREERKSTENEMEKSRKVYPAKKKLTLADWQPLTYNMQPQLHLLESITVIWRDARREWRMDGWPKWFYGD